MNPCTSSQETYSTGQRSDPLFMERFHHPMTASHSLWVTSYLPSSIVRLITTRVSGRSSEDAYLCLERIRKLPAGTGTNSIPAMAASAAAFASSAEFSNRNASR